MIVNVAVCFDKDFEWLLPIVCKSLLSFNSFNKIKLHIVSNTNLVDLQTHNIDYKFYVKDISDYEYIGLKHVTKSTMLRLFLPEILKDVEGNIIYVDLDVINHKIDREYLNDQQPSQYILHYAGRRKPWGSWKRDEVYCYNKDIWEKFNNT